MNSHFKYHYGYINLTIDNEYIINIRSNIKKSSDELDLINRNLMITMINDCINHSPNGKDLYYAICFFTRLHTVSLKNDLNGDIFKNVVKKCYNNHKFDKIVLLLLHFNNDYFKYINELIIHGQHSPMFNELMVKIIDKYSYKKFKAGNIAHLIAINCLQEIDIKQLFDYIKYYGNPNLLIQKNCLNLTPLEMIKHRTFSKINRISYHEVCELMNNSEKLALFFQKTKIYSYFKRISRLMKIGYNKIHLQLKYDKITLSYLLNYFRLI